MLDSPTSFAVSAAFVDNEIVSGQGMSSQADFLLPSGLPELSSTDVLDMENWFEMVRVNAIWSSTLMIEFELLWDRSSEKFERESMRSDDLTAPEEVAITSGVFSSDPQPASGCRLLNELGGEAVWQHESSSGWPSQACRLLMAAEHRQILAPPFGFRKRAGDDKS